MPHRIPSLRRAIRRHPVVSLCFALAIVVALGLSLRLTVFAVHDFRSPPEDPPITAWMTPRFVVKTWHVPRDVMEAALGEGPMPDKRRTIGDIARDQGISPDELAARIEAAAMAWREANP